MAYEYLDLSGVILPDTATTRSEVEAEWRTAFGADLIVTPNTPQGVMITADVLSRDNLLRNNAELANQINPDLAGGVFLDALMALTGTQRIAATRSMLLAVAVGGVPGSIIPEGALARLGANGEIFASTGAVVLSPTGTGLATFRAVNYGPITAAPGQLDTIVSGVLGWETVSNPAAAIPGTLEESDAAARRRRRETLGNQGTALPEATVGALYEVDGVTSVQFRENYTDAPLTFDSFTLVPHSILAIVQGGTDTDVATAVLGKKSLGANFNGATLVNVTNAVTGQVYPVKFQRPSLINVWATFTVNQGTYVGNPSAAIKAAVLSYANGEVDGEAGFQIGADVTAFELAGAVARVAPGLLIKAATIGNAPTPTGTLVDILTGELAVITEGRISVTVE